MLFHQYFLRAINLELYQLLFCSAWVAVAGSRPLLGGLGACGGSLDWDWAGWGLGWALMGSGWGLGDDWASPPTPVEPCDRTQPGPPKFQTITNPPPRILSRLKPLTLITPPPVSFLFSCRSSSIPTYGTDGETDWVINRFVHSERSTRQCAHLVGYPPTCL